MTTFDERREEFEKRYFHEEELLFKARSRRNKLFGLEVAERIGKRGEEAAEYAKKLVLAATLDPSGDAGLVSRAAADLEAAGQPALAAELRGLLAGLMERAAEQIHTE